MPSSVNSHCSLALKMSTESVNYVVTGNNIEMTPSLNDYVNKKLDKVVGKLSASGAVQECDVHLSVNKNPKVRRTSCKPILVLKWCNFADR